MYFKASGVEENEASSCKKSTLEINSDNSFRAKGSSSKATQRIFISDQFAVRSNIFRLLSSKYKCNSPDKEYLSV